MKDALERTELPVIAHVFRDAVYLNVRTIEEDEYPLIAKALGGAENCDREEQ